MIAAQPPGPGLRRQAPSVHTSASPGGPRPGSRRCGRSGGGRVAWRAILAAAPAGDGGASRRRSGSSSPAWSWRPRRCSGSPLTSTGVVARKAAAWPPASITPASLSSCPSRIISPRISTSRSIVGVSAARRAAAPRPRARRRRESPSVELAAVQRGLLGDDREAEAGAVGPRVRAAGERLEQPLALGGGDAGAVVLDADDAAVPSSRSRPTATLPPPARPCSAALSSRLSTIRRRPPSQPSTVPSSTLRRPARSATPGWRLRAPWTAASSDVAELDRLARQAARRPRRAPAPAGPRAGGPCGPARRSCRRPARRAARRGSSGLRASVSRFARIAGQRRAQLVAGVGGEAAGRLERALGGGGRRAEALEHRVQRAGERADLLRPLVVGQRRREVLARR